MYKSKTHHECNMPQVSDPLKVLVLNASLKHAPNTSNTEELVSQVLTNMSSHNIQSETIRLADLIIPVGLNHKESEDDEWPSVVEKIKSADIVIFATPIWWGSRSSLMQRVIERMDALDEDSHNVGREVLMNKVAGIVITGSEDGAQSTLGAIMEVLTWMNFTLPPQCAAYWVGEVGMDPKEDLNRIKSSAAAKSMTQNMARNLVYYAKLLKQHPMVYKK